MKQNTGKWHLTGLFDISICSHIASWGLPFQLLLLEYTYPQHTIFVKAAVISQFSLRAPLTIAGLMAQPIIGQVSFAILILQFLRLIFILARCLSHPYMLCPIKL